MKLKRYSNEPLLKRKEGKQTPHSDWNNARDLQIELKRLGLAPKLEKGRVIVSG